MIKCSVCGYENPDDGEVCLNCGSPIEKAAQGEAIDDINGEATVLLGMPAVPSDDSDKPRDKEEPAQAPPPPAKEEKPAEPAGSPPPPPPPPPPPSQPNPEEKPAAPPPPAAPAPPPPAATPAAATPPPPATPAGSGSVPPPAAAGSSSGGSTGSSNVNILAIISLILGIIGIIPCCILFGIAAVVLGFLGKKQIEESGGTQEGAGFATAGLICGAVGIVINLIVMIVGALL